MSKHPSLKRALVLLSALCIASGGLNFTAALAATEVVPMERLHVHDVVFLPTVRSAYQARFTKPKTWNVSSLNLSLSFQHSHELLPNRSWLEVIVNNKLIKHIPLTKENAEGTTMNLAIPPGILKDFNTLMFRVEQHYTDKCEDPLDKSLWTQVLPETRLTFNYTPTVPQVDLGTYPYPIIDPLTYAPAAIRYITSEQASAKELQALAYVNVHLGQEAGVEKEMRTRSTFHNRPGPDSEHIVFVGTPDHLPGLSAYQSQFGDLALSGGQWVNRATGQAVGPDQGVLLFFQAPGSQQHTVLVVSGNSDAAVFEAAQYLTTRPRQPELLGKAMETPPGWAPSGNRSFKVPRYVNEKTISFRELGYGIQEVQKIYAPPITYHVPVVSNFRRQNGQLFLDLVYSYGPGMNPLFSSLELRLNDMSIANIPLMNEQGEQLARASIPVPRDLIGVRNDLVAQFHMLPDKYGWCVDNYEDKAWGKIMDDSSFRVQGTPASRLPDIGLLNNTMFPYSREDNLENMHVVVPNAPSEPLLDAMLAFTGRLGRATMAENTDLRFELSQGGGGIPGGKNIVVFRRPGDNLSAPGDNALSWLSGGLAGKMLRQFVRPEDNKRLQVSLTENGDGSYLEQLMEGGRAVTIVTSPEAAGFRQVDRLFEVDSAFEDLTSGYVEQLSTLNPEQNPIEKPVYHMEEAAKSNGPGWMPGWLSGLLSGLPPWLQNLPWSWILLGLLGVFFLMLVVPLLFRRR